MTGSGIGPASSGADQGSVMRMGRRLGIAAAVTLVVMVAAVPVGAVFTGLTTNPGNSFSAAVASCDSVSPVWLTGFESGAISAAGAAVTPAASLLNTATASATADTTVTRSGNYAMQIVKAAAAGHYVSKTNLGGGAVVTMRLAFRFQTALPGANQTELAKIDISTGGDVILGYNNTAPKTFTLGHVGGTAQSGPAGGLIINNWYRLDLRVNVAASPHTIDWQIDGVPQTQAIIAQGADTFAGNVFLGSTVNADVFTAHYDDVLVSLTSADYPIGDGQTLPLVPNSYVGKTDFTPAYLKETSSATDLSATSYQMLDETPMSGIGDWVQQTTGSATPYWAEFGFENVTRTACVNGVSAVAALHSAGTTANSVQTAIHTGGATRFIHAAGSVATAAVQYRSAVIASIDGTWDAAELTAATARVGYRLGAGSVPYWDGVRLEYDQVPNAASGYANVVLADSPASYWRLGDRGSTATASAGAATGTYTNNPNRSVGGAVGDTNTAVSFDGTNDYINFGDIYDFAGRVNFTAEAWIRPIPSANGEPGYGVISNIVDNTNGRGWSFTYGCPACAGANKLRFFLLDVNGSGDSSHIGTTVLTHHRWYHVAAVFDGTNTRIYLNGVLETATPWTRVLPAQSSPLLVGTVSEDVDLGGYIGFHKGTIDEVAIYSTALDATRILAHYNAGKP
jgi:hypothetical protein